MPVKTLWAGSLLEKLKHVMIEVSLSIMIVYAVDEEVEIFV